MIITRDRTYTVDPHEMSVASIHAEGSLAWVKGFSQANAAVDERSCTDVAEVFREVGLYECPDGLCGQFCAHSLNSVRRRNGLRGGTEWDFVDGVLESVAANGPLLGGSHV